MRIQRFAFALALGFLTMHLALLLVLPSPGLVSNLIQVVPPLLAAIVVYRRSLRASGLTQIKWQLLAMGIGFWTVGQLLYCWFKLVLNRQQTAAIPSDFYFFLWGVPVLLAIVAGDGENDVILLGLDSVQAFLAVALVYVELFAVKAGPDSRAMGAVPLMYFYMGESLILAVAASLKLLARPTRRENRFHRILAMFLWAYVLASVPANYADALWNVPDGTLVDLLWDLPFLAVLWLCAPGSTPGMPKKDAGDSHTTTGTLMLSNACSASFTIAVLIMAARMCGERFALGVTAMGLALFTYTARSSLLQTRYMQSQQALASSERALRAVNEQLEELSLQDALTGIANRRRFEQVFEIEWNRALRAGTEISVLMIDVDHFKQINDLHGHQQGDLCLAAIAKELSDRLRRGGDLLARYGGEEFVAILPGVSGEEALRVAEILRSGVSSLTGEHLWICRERRLTVSIGLSWSRPSYVDTPGRLIERADSALYRAKQNGRNRVEVNAAPSTDTLLTSVLEAPVFSS